MTDTLPPPPDPMTSIRVVRFEGSVHSWDQLLRDFPAATFCHLGAWRDVLGGVFGHEAHYLVAEGPDGDIQGMLPLVSTRSRLFGDYLLSMPFLSYGGPLGSPAARESLGQAAVELARDLEVDLLEIRSRAPTPGPFTTSERKLTVLLDLPETPDELWDGFRSKLRSQIRRPTKAGLTARIGTDLTDPFYSVFSRTMRDLGTPVLPKSFFAAIAKRFPHQVLYSVVDGPQGPVGAGCGFLFRDEYEITWAGTLREANRMSPNMLLYWSLMEASILRGATVFNFGRCTPGSGTHRFKSQWGGEDHTLPWGQWSPQGVAGTPSPDSAKFRLATSVWSRLPVGLTNMVGPWLARSLP